MSAALRNLTLRQLRALAETIAGGSVTQAAERLGVTQPAITLQLQNLQQLAGLTLIQRTALGIRATEAGRILVDLEERIRLALADSIARLDAMNGLCGGRVAIGAVSTGKYFVPSAIGAFARKYPDIDLKLSIGNRAQIIDGLRNFSLDIAITGRPPEDMELDRRQIGPHPHIVIAGPGHPLARSRGISFAQLAGDLFIMREPGSGTRLLMEKHLETIGFTPRIGMEIDSNETIKQAVMAGLGIAFLSAHTTANEIAQGRLVALDLQGLPLTRQWFVVSRTDKPLMPAALALRDFMASEATRFLPVL